MSVAERISSANLLRKPTLTEWLASLNEEDLAAIEAAGRGPAADTALELFIRAENVALSKYTLRAWRETL